VTFYLYFPRTGMLSPVPFQSVVDAMVEARTLHVDAYVIAKPSPGFDGALVAVFAPLFGNISQQEH
jgi:hypothetical protein